MEAATRTLHRRSGFGGTLFSKVRRFSLSGLVTLPIFGKNHQRSNKCTTDAGRGISRSFCKPSTKVVHPGHPKRCQLINIGWGKIINTSPTAPCTGDSHHPIKITGGRWLPKIFIDSHHGKFHPSSGKLDPNKLEEASRQAFAPIRCGSLSIWIPQMVLACRHPKECRTKGTEPPSLANCVKICIR